MSRARLIGFLLVLAVGVASWVATCGAWQVSRVAARVAPLAPRSFERMTLIALGTGGEFENPARRGPALAVGTGERVVLVDAGRSVAEALRLAQLPPSQPDTVLLTNLLPENTVGLDDLLVSGWIAGRAQPLRLVGPAGTAELARALEQAQGPGLAARARALDLSLAGARFEVLEIADGWSEARGELSLRAGAIDGGPLPALAYRFESGGRSLVVAGTGWAQPGLADFARDADVLVHEAAFIPTPAQAEELGVEADAALLGREAALHTSIEAVGSLARAARVRTLVLVRLRPPPVYDLQLTSLVDDHFDGRIVVAEDGDELTP